MLPDGYLDDHFSIDDLSKKWRISRETVRLLVKDEPDVIRIQLGKKRKMCRYSIPSSAAKRIHTLLLAPAFVNTRAA